MCEFGLLCGEFSNEFVPACGGGIGLSLLLFGTGILTTAGSSVSVERSTTTAGFALTALKNVFALS